MAGQHTPLPWSLGWEDTICANGNEWAEIPLPSGWAESTWIGGRATEESKANAAFIVRACNSHDDLLEALETVLAYREGRKPFDFHRISDAEQRANETFDAWQDVEQRVRAAIAKAKGDAL